MIWKKILHRRLTFSFAVFSLFSLFWLFGLSSNVSATSLTCTATLTDTSHSGGIYIYYSNGNIEAQNYSNFHTDNPDCPSTLSFFPSYVTISNLNVTSLDTNNSLTVNVSNRLVVNNITSSIDLSSISLTHPTFYYGGDGSIIHYASGSQEARIGFYVNNWGNFSLTVDIEWSDTLGGGSTPCPEPPEPDCPDPIDPDAPYSGKLDDIKRAIYVCGSILLVIYFFFCIYKIVIKDGGSR